MDFIFQGFQSSLPLWSYLLILVGTVLLAWWSYRDVGGIGPVSRYTLVSLRSAVFFILLLLLANPFIKTETSHTKRPKILVMMDNSASTGIEKSRYQGEESYQNVLETLNFTDSSTIDFDLFSVGRASRSSSVDSLTFDADQTNLSRAIQTIKANQQEADAAVLISDGIYTQGQNPVFETEGLQIPLFTVGLGDTTSQRDLLVRSVSTNSTGYLDTSQPVSVTVSSRGFKGQSFRVQLLDGEEVLSSKTVVPEISNSTQDISFDLSLKEEGLQQYEVRIPRLADEWSGDNNSQRFSVDVKDARQSILSIAFEIHPDVQFFRSLLLADKNTQLTKRTWINGSRFIEGDFNINPDSVDLAIIHGYPNAGLPAGVERTLADIARNVPLIIAATPLFSPQRFETEVGSLPVGVMDRWDFSQVRIRPSDENSDHPLMELPGVSFDRLPQLSAPLNNITGTPGVTSLFTSHFQSQATGKPVLAVQELGNRRLSFLSAFGWYKFNQNTTPQVREFGRQLMMNIVSWTATSPDNQLLEVTPAQTTFSGSEKVILNAYLTNERGEVESDAAIDVSVSSDSSGGRLYSMENLGSGRYRLDLGTMPQGIYSFEATAEKGDRELDRQSGEFAVARSNVEYLNTTRNDQLLRQLADRTGGTYTTYDSLDNFWNQLREQGLLDRNEKFRTSYFYPYQHIGWFILVLLLLAGEWILRKYLSLP